MSDLPILINAAVSVATPPAAAFLVRRHAPKLVYSAVMLAIAGAGNAALSIFTVPNPDIADAVLVGIGGFVVAWVTDAGWYHPKVTGDNGAIQRAFPRGLGRRRTRAVQTPPLSPR